MYLLQIWLEYDPLTRNPPKNFSKLSGCQNDSLIFRSTLNAIRSQRAKDVRVLLSDERRHLNTPMFANRQNILREIELAMEWVRSNNDLLVIQYTGHGYYMVDKDRDEGRDSVLFNMLSSNEFQVPVQNDSLMVTHEVRAADTEGYGYISDDELNALLRKNSVQTLLVFDCCHSGTIADLPYAYIVNDGALVRGVSSSKHDDQKSPMCCISGAQDDQLAFEASINIRMDPYLRQAMEEATLQTNYRIFGNFTVTLCDELLRQLRINKHTDSMTLLFTRLHKRLKHIQVPVISFNIPDHPDDIQIRQFFPFASEEERPFVEQTYTMYDVEQSVEQDVEHSVEQDAVEQDVVVEQTVQHSVEQNTEHSVEQNTEQNEIDVESTTASNNQSNTASNTASNNASNNQSTASNNQSNTQSNDANNTTLSNPNTIVITIINQIIRMLRKLIS